MKHLPLIFTSIALIYQTVIVMGKDDKIRYLQHENNAIRNMLIQHADSCHSKDIHTHCFKIGK